MTGGTHAISIVDDDDAVRDSMHLLLEACGYAVRDYDSAAAVLNDPAARDCCCLILDLHMPGMDGLTLLEHLREDGFDAAALLVTGRGDPRDERISRTGILARLQKPVADNVLLEWVERACEAA